MKMFKKVLLGVLASSAVITMSLNLSITFNPILEINIMQRVEVASTHEQIFVKSLLPISRLDGESKIT